MNSHVVAKGILHDRRTRTLHSEMPDSELKVRSKAPQKYVTKIVPALGPGLTPF